MNLKDFDRIIIPCFYKAQSIKEYLKNNTTRLFIKKDSSENSSIGFDSDLFYSDIDISSNEENKCNTFNKLENIHLVLLSINLKKKKIIVYGYDKLFEKLSFNNNHQLIYENLSFDYNSLLVNDQELMINIENAKKFFDYYLLIICKNDLISKIDSTQYHAFRHNLIPDEIQTFNSEDSSDDEYIIKIREWTVKCAYYRYSKDIIISQLNFNVKMQQTNKSNNYSKNLKKEDNTLVSLKNLYNSNSKQRPIRKIDFSDEKKVENSSYYSNINMIKFSQAPVNDFNTINKGISESNTISTLSNIININTFKESRGKVPSNSKSTFISDINIIKKASKNSMINIEKDVEVIIPISEEELEENEFCKLEKYGIMNKQYRNCSSSFINKFQNIAKNRSIKKSKCICRDLQINLIEDQDFQREDWKANDVNKIIETTEEKFDEFLDLRDINSIHEICKGEEIIIKYEDSWKEKKMFLEKNKNKLTGKNLAFVIEEFTSTKISDEMSNDMKSEIIDLELKDEKLNFKINMNQQNKNFHIINNNLFKKIEKDNNVSNDKLTNYNINTSKIKKCFNNNIDNISSDFPFKKEDFRRSSLHDPFISNKFSINDKSYNLESQAKYKNFSNNESVYKYMKSSDSLVLNSPLPKFDYNRQMIDQIIYICRSIDYISNRESFVYADEDKEYLMFYICLEILRSKKLLKSEK